MENWYVYALVDPRNGQPFYVGKGRRSRARWHLKSNHGSNLLKRLLIREIRASGFEPLIVYLYTNLNEQDAFDFEVLEIICYGRRPNGFLTNMNSGGAGQSGFSPSKTTRVKLSEALRGAKNPFYGKKHTVESLAKIGAVNKDKPLSDYQRQKISEFWKGRPKSDAQRRRASEAQAGKRLSPEHARRVAEANRRRSAKLEVVV